MGSLSPPPSSLDRILWSIIPTLLPSFSPIFPVPSPIFPHFEGSFLSMRYSLAFLSFFHVRVSFLSLVSNCFVPLIIFGFKYQPEFFSGAVYRGVKSMVNGERHWAIVLEQKRGKREGGREGESRWKIALDREFENRVPSKTTLIRLDRFQCVPQSNVCGITRNIHIRLCRRGITVFSFQRFDFLCKIRTNRSLNFSHVSHMMHRVFFFIIFQFLFSSMKIMSKFVTLFSITRSFCPAFRSIDEIPYHAFLSLQSIGEGVKFEFEKTFGNVI